MEAVSIVTIKNKINLYKKEEPANSIELIELEEVGFKLVAQKDLYSIGDKAVYIQPDYCVSDISLFESYIKPNGDESKSMLGKVEGKPRRIRAKKFTLSIEPNGDSVYSNGILLPLNEVKSYLVKSGILIHNQLVEDRADFLTKDLGITKYEEPEVTNKFGIKTGGGKVFPEGVYKTDEENINNLWNHIEKNIGYPITLVGTSKIDGSSISIGLSNKYPDGFICSRNLSKPIKIKKIIGRRNKKWSEYLFFWKEYDLNIYEVQDNDDDFVKFGKPLLDVLIKEDLKIILRGELNGGSAKGSGNKNNPASKEPMNIKIFGIDYFDDNGLAIKTPFSLFSEYCNKYNFPVVDVIFNKQFNSREELEKECNDYFKQNMIEGIVVKTLDSKFSAKFMNLYYDSKK